MVAVRYIYVTDNMRDMLAFYRDVLGMPVISGSRVIGSENDGFVELGAGSFSIALHRSGTPGVAGHCRHKLVFTATDVPAEREALVTKGLHVSRVYTWGEVQYCDFEDPDGNLLQLSNR